MSKKTSFFGRFFGNDDDQETDQTPPAGRGIPTKAPVKKTTGRGRGKNLPTLPPKPHVKKTHEQQKDLASQGGDTPGSKQQPKENPMSNKELETLQNNVAFIHATLKRLVNIEELNKHEKQFDTKPLIGISKQDLAKKGKETSYSIGGLAGLLYSLLDEFEKNFGDGTKEGYIKLADKQVNLAEVLANTEAREDFADRISALETKATQAQAAVAGISQNDLDDAIDGLKIADLRRLVNEAIQQFGELKKTFVTKKQVDKKIEAALNDLDLGLNETAVKKVVNDIVKDLDLGQSEADVEGQIETALNDLEVGLNETAVKKVVNDIVGKLELGQSEADVEGQIETAITALDLGLNEAAVKKVVNDIVKDLDLDKRFGEKANEAGLEARIKKIVEAQAALGGGKKAVKLDAVEQLVKEQAEKEFKALSDDKLEAVAKKVIEDLELEQSVQGLKAELDENGPVYTSLNGLDVRSLANEATLKELDTETLQKFVELAQFEYNPPMSKTDYEAAVAAIDAKVTDNTITAEEGKKEKEDLENTQKALGEQRKEFRKLRKTFQGILTKRDFEVKINGITESLNTLQAEIESVKTAKPAGDGSTVDLSGVNGEIDGLKTLVQELGDKVAAVETKDFASQFGNLEDQINVINAQIESLSSGAASKSSSSEGVIKVLSAFRSQIEEIAAFVGATTGPKDSFDDYYRNQLAAVYAKQRPGKDLAWENPKRNLLKDVFEKLGLKGTSSKKRARTDLVNVLRTLIAKEGSVDALRLYVTYRSLDNVTQEIFGFVGSDLGKFDGKNLKELGVKIDQHGNFTSKDQDALIGSFVDSKPNVLADLDVSRSEVATQFVVIRGRIFSCLSKSTDANVHTHDPMGLTPVHLALLSGALSNNNELQNAVNGHNHWYSQPDAFGNTPFHFAAASYAPFELDGEDYAHHAGLVFDELVKNGADPFAVNDQGYRPVDVALATGNVAFIKWYMQTFNTVTVIPPKDMNYSDANNHYLLNRAIELGNVISVSQVLSCLPQGAANMVNRNGDKPIHVAAAKGDVTLLDAFVNPENNTLRVNIFAKNKEGKTPVEVAAEKGHKDAVTWFALHGAKLKRNVEKHMDNLLNTVEMANRLNTGDYANDIRPWWLVNVWQQNEKHDTTVKRIHQSFIRYGKDEKAEAVGLGAKVKSSAKAGLSFLITKKVTNDATDKDLKKADDPRVKLINRPRHVAIKEHLLAGLKAIDSTLDRQAEKVLGKKDAPRYYAFAPENYNHKDKGERLKGEARKDAKADAQAKAEVLPELMYLRELMVAYYIYSVKMDKGIDTSKSHNYGIFAETLVDTIVALANEITDRAGIARVDAAKLMLTCHQGPEAISGHEIFAALGAEYSRENVLGKHAKEHLAKEKGQDKEGVFKKFLLDESKSSKSGNTKQSGKAASDEKEDKAKKGKKVKGKKEKKDSEVDSEVSEKESDSKPKPEPKKKVKGKKGKKGDEEEKKDSEVDSEVSEKESEKESDSKPEPKKKVKGKKADEDENKDKDDKKGADEEETKKKKKKTLRKRKDAGEKDKDATKDSSKKKGETKESEKDSNPSDSEESTAKSSTL